MLDRRVNRVCIGVGSGGGSGAHAAKEFVSFLDFAIDAPSSQV